MKYFVLLLVALLSYDASAQVIPLEVPMQFGYQAVVRNSSNILIVNRPVAVKATILVGGASGTPVYVETHTPTTNANGLLTMTIGGGTAVSGSFRNISWVPSNHYLRTVIDPDPMNGSSSDTISTTSQLLSVPYAIVANTALFAGTANVVRAPQIGDKFGGGIVFAVWRDSTGQHGLIASLQDLAPRPWASPIIGSTAVGSSHDDGEANTRAIIAAAGTTSAAGACATYSAGDSTDWYLPAARELNLLYTNVTIINAALDNDNDPRTTGLNAREYWSSTIVTWSENNRISRAFSLIIKGLNFSTPGEFNDEDQTESLAVRAIRRF